MEKIRINRSRLSDIVWRTIFENSSGQAAAIRAELLKKSESLDYLRVQASYNTGSIGSGAIWALFSACFFFKPKVVAEVGTFIGKSTFAMACAIDSAYQEGGEIFTCDFSNSIDLNFATKTSVRQFQMKSSTDMFTGLAAENRQCDLILLDGRLQAEDFKLLPAILHPETVVLLDDFEGTEKGVINAMHLMNSLQTTHYLAYPPSREIMHNHGLTDGCTIGMIIPRRLVEHTNQ
ncbi:MAG: class I SAM-dependent methyltransferase [bacterium]|jgi:predicted O-methyltransferase YrrM